MRWVRLVHDRSCQICGADTERFVGLIRHGRRAIEVTFCPDCCPEVKDMWARRVRKRRTRSERDLALAS